MLFVCPPVSSVHFRTRALGPITRGRAVVGRVARRWPHSARLFPMPYGLVCPAGRPSRRRRRAECRAPTWPLLSYRSMSMSDVSPKRSLRRDQSERARHICGSVHHLPPCGCGRCRVTFLLSSASCRRRNSENVQTQHIQRRGARASAQHRRDICAPVKRSCSPGHARPSMLAR